MSAKADAFCTRPTDTVGQESLSSQNKSIFFYGGGASSGVSKWMTTLPVQPFVLLIIILLFYISLGKFIEGMAMLLLTIPFVFSILQGFGYERL
jgi:TRAP-type C4-dicarboxylate transport system permease large subunit